MENKIFLHKKILASGKRNKKVDVKNYHFNGISTFLLFSNRNSLVKNLSSHLIFSEKITKRLVSYGFARVLEQKRNYCTLLINKNMEFYSKK